MAYAPRPSVPPCPRCGEHRDIRQTELSAAGAYWFCDKCGYPWHYDQMRARLATESDQPKRKWDG